MSHPSTNYPRIFHGVTPSSPTPPARPLHHRHPSGSCRGNQSSWNKTRRFLVAAQCCHRKTQARSESDACLPKYWPDPGLPRGKTKRHQLTEQWHTISRHQRANRRAGERKQNALPKYSRHSANREAPSAVLMATSRARVVLRAIIRPAIFAHVVSRIARTPTASTSIAGRVLPTNCSRKGMGDAMTPVFARGYSR